MKKAMDKVVKAELRLVEVALRQAFLAGAATMDRLTASRRQYGHASPSKRTRDKR